MSITIITNGIYSKAGNIIAKVAEKCGSRIITDNEIIDYTQKKFNIKLATLKKVIEDEPLAFNDFTHEREKCIAFMKKAISELASDEDVIFCGILGHLIPQQITHALRVLIIADKKNRIKQGVKATGLTENEVVGKIDAADKKAIVWTNRILNKKAWDRSLYDIIIPTDKMGEQESIELIVRSLERQFFSEEERVKKELEDLDIIARVEIALSSLGKGLLVTSRNGCVVVTIDRKVMMLRMFQKKIIQSVEKIAGVNSVTTKIGRNFYKDTIVRNFEFETPLRLLLADDDKEFIQTISERLKNCTSPRVKSSIPNSRPPISQMKKMLR